jgi:type I restriction enzyme S subunit
MNQNWSRVSLGELIRRSDETIEPVADKEYSEITVRLWGKGVIERGRVLGTDLVGRRFVAHTRQFIASRIDARHGATGLIPPSLDGAVVTNDFPLFNIRHERLDGNFFGWLCRTADFVELCRRASEGTTNRVRLKEHRFYALEIPLPPIAEQRCIVERIEELAAEIEEARSLRREADKERAEIWPSILKTMLLGDGKRLSGHGDNASSLLAAAERRNVAFHKSKHNNAHPYRPTVICDGPKVIPKEWVWTTLGSVITHLIDCINDTPDFAETNTGLLGLKSTNIRPYKLDLSQRWYVPPEYFAQWNRRETPVPGDIILTREAPMGNACMLPLGHSVCLTQRLMLLRADSETIEPWYLLHYLNSPIFQDQVKEHCRGLTTPHIRVQDAPNFLLPLPPKNEQIEIVRALAELRTEVTALSELQSETAAELDALLPSILDHAFRGEL